MKYKWLNKQNKRDLIVFFNGWGMDEQIVSHLETNNFDILMFYDYNTLETNFDFYSINNYDNKYLVAWSMGVMIATLFNIKYTLATAINGTLKPIDNDYGIMTKIYDLTINNFSETSSKKFIKNMFNSSHSIPDLKRDFQNIKEELIALKSYKANLDFKYNKIIISNNDKIIPTKNQIRFWNQEANLEAGHCPFLLFKTWDELL